MRKNDDKNKTIKFEEKNNIIEIKKTICDLGGQKFLEANIANKKISLGYVKVE